MHGRGDRAVSADQLKGLVPGTRFVEKGHNDRGDVGAGDRAAGNRRGSEPDPAGGRSVGEAARAQDRYQRHDRKWKRYEKQLPGHQGQIDVKFIAPLAARSRKATTPPPSMTARACGCTSGPAGHCEPPPRS